MTGSYGIGQRSSAASGTATYAQPTSRAVGSDHEQHAEGAGRSRDRLGEPCDPAPTLALVAAANRIAQLLGPAVDTDRFIAHGEAAEQAAFKGDDAYSYGEFAGGSDSWTYGRRADGV